MVNIINSYPHTDFHELNLDYILSILHATEDHVTELNNEVSLLVKDVEIISNSYLKVTFQNGAVKTYALPSGENYVVRLRDQENGTKMNELDVGDTALYDSEPGVLDTFFGAIIAGIPVRLVYETKSGLGQWIPIYVTSLDVGVNLVHFWTSEDTNDSPYFINKSFQLTYDTVGGVDYFQVKRLS